MSGESLRPDRDWLPKAKELMAQINPDPTISAIVPESVTNLKKVGVNATGMAVLKDEHGRRFHTLADSRNPADQMFLARILKGILPVSDILYAESGQRDAYMSHHARVDAIGDMPKDNRWGDVLFLDVVFSDDEHVRRGMNFKKDKSKYIHFDFHDFGDEFLHQTDAGFIDEKYVESAIDCIPRNYQNRAIKNALERLPQFRRWFEGERFYSHAASTLASMEKLGAEKPHVIENAPGKDKIQTFQKEVLRRIDLLEFVLTKHAE